MTDDLYDHEHGDACESCVEEPWRAAVRHVLFGCNDPGREWAAALAWRTAQSAVAADRRVRGYAGSVGLDGDVRAQVLETMRVAIEALVEAHRDEFDGYIEDLAGPVLTGGER